MVVVGSLHVHDLLIKLYLSRGECKHLVPAISHYDSHTQVTQVTQPNLIIYNLVQTTPRCESMDLPVSPGADDEVHNGKPSTT